MCTTQEQTYTIEFDKQQLVMIQQCIKTAMLATPEILTVVDELNNPVCSLLDGMLTDVIDHPEGDDVYSFVS